MFRIIQKYKHEFILTILILIYISYFTLASFLRYDNFYTGRFDLGNMDQTVWNTINGRIFQTSDDDGNIISRLSSHADFMLILLSPSYLLWAHPKMLLLIQSIVLGIGAIFVFLIARNILKDKNLALVLGVLYLASPAIQFTNLYDFHAVTIATTTLLAAFYFLLKQKYFFMILFLILSGFAKEQIWTITSIFGLFLFFKTRKTKILGLGIAFFSLIIFGYLIWNVIPGNAGGEHFALSYYSSFGSSPTEIIKNVIFSPQKIISIILEPSRIDYLKQLFMPLGFMSLLAPLYLIFTIPDLLINLLSNNPQLHQIYYQYSAAITPFIFISSIFGVKQLIKWFPKIPKSYIAMYLIFFAFFSAYLTGPLPGTKNPNTDMFTKPQVNKAIIENFLSKIPEHYTVAATNNLGSHASHRQQIFTIPLGIGKADMVIFLLNGDSSQSVNEEKEMVENLRKNKNYVEFFKKDDFIVFKKRSLLL